MIVYRLSLSEVHSPVYEGAGRVAEACVRTEDVDTLGVAVPLEGVELSAVGRVDRAGQPHLLPLLPHKLLNICRTAC